MKRQRISGFGLLEALVGTVLIGIFVLSMSYLVTQFRSTSSRISGPPQCVARLQGIIDQFQAQDNKSRATISRWHPTATEATPAPPGTPVPGEYINSQFPFFAKSNGSAVTSTVGASPQFNNWTLLNDGVNWATALYNEKDGGGLPLFSEDPALFATATLQTSTISNIHGYIDPNNSKFKFLLGIVNQAKPLKDEQVYINVLKSELKADGAVTWPVPASTPLRMPLLNPSSVENLGFKVSLQVWYHDNDNNPKSCQHTIELRPSADRVPPTFEMPLTTQFPAAPFNSISDSTQQAFGNIPTVTPFPFPISKITFSQAAPNPTPNGAFSCQATSSIQLAVAANEPGVAFLCDLEVGSNFATMQYPIPGPNPNELQTFKPCIDFTATNDATYSGKALAYATDVPTQTALLIEIRKGGGSIDNMGFRLTMVAVDMAGNKSSLRTFIFGSDTQAPTNYDISGPFSTVSPLAPGDTSLLQTFVQANDQKGHTMTATLAGTFRNQLKFEYGNYKDPAGNPNMTVAPYDKFSTDVPFQCQASSSEQWSITGGNGSVSPVLADWYFDSATVTLANSSIFTQPAASDNDGAHFVTAIFRDSCSQPTVPSVSNAKRVYWRTDRNLPMPNPSLSASVNANLTGYISPIPAPASAINFIRGTPPQEELEFVLSPLKKDVNGTNIVKYTCPQKTGGWAVTSGGQYSENWATNNSSCRPSDLSFAASTIGSCSRGPQVFASKGYDGCGRTPVSTVAEPYQTLGKLGDNCRFNPCEPGLICQIDNVSGNQYKCINPINCAGTCAGGLQCYQRINPGPLTCTCGGGSIGPSFVNPPITNACPDLDNPVNPVTAWGPYPVVPLALCVAAPPPVPATCGNTVAVGGVPPESQVCRGPGGSTDTTYDNFMVDVSAGALASPMVQFVVPAPGYDFEISMIDSFGATVCGPSVVNNPPVGARTMTLTCSPALARGKEFKLRIKTMELGNPTNFVWNTEGDANACRCRTTEPQFKIIGVKSNSGISMANYSNILADDISGRGTLSGIFVRVEADPVSAPGWPSNVSPLLPGFTHLLRVRGFLPNGNLINNFSFGMGLIQDVFAPAANFFEYSGTGDVMVTSKLNSGDPLPYMASPVFNFTIGKKDPCFADLMGDANAQSECGICAIPAANVNIGPSGGAAGVTGSNLAVVQTLAESYCMPRAACEKYIHRYVTYGNAPANAPYTLGPPDNGVIGGVGCMVGFVNGGNPNCTFRGANNNWARANFNAIRVGGVVNLARQAHCSGQPMTTGQTKRVTSREIHGEVMELINGGRCAPQGTQPPCTDATVLPLYQAFDNED